MTLYAVSEFTKSLKHYAVFGVVCAGVGLYLGSCSSCSTKNSATESESAANAHDVNGAQLVEKQKPHVPTRIEFFEQYTEPYAESNRNKERFSSTLEYRVSR